MDRRSLVTIGEYTGLRPRKPWCDGKQAFKSEGAANAAVRSLRRRTDFQQHGESTVYRCSTCGFWHQGRRGRPR